jgi:hypothetical protein
MMPRRFSARWAQLLALLLIVVAGLFLSLGRAGAQETPEATETPVPDTDVLVSMQYQPPAEKLKSGDEIAVSVNLENVEHLAGFDFFISYDPEKVDFVRTENAGEFLATGDRQDMQCPETEPRDGQASASCITLGPPVCLGGAAGASGGGLLGTMVFSAKGDGDATLQLASSTLVKDDYDPPCPADSSPVQIPTRLGEDITVPIEGGGSGSSNTTWYIVGAVVVVAALALGGGLFWLRSRRNRASS